MDVIGLTLHNNPIRSGITVPGNLPFSKASAEGSLPGTAEGSLLKTAEGSLLRTAEGSLLKTAEGSLLRTAEGSAPLSGFQRNSAGSSSGESDSVEQSLEEQGQAAAASDAASSRAEVQRMERERVVISGLAKRDREVRSHELAHAAAGGQFAGSPVFEFTRGPDGVNYATSGHVSIDASEVSGDAAATLQKAQVVQRAAMAPAEPSSADRAVAAKAAQMAAQARVDLMQERMEGIDPSASGQAKQPHQPGQIESASKNTSENTSGSIASEPHTGPPEGRIPREKVYQQVENNSQQGLGSLLARA
ncbi:MAG: hypothetical protein KUG75_08980 [Pseudomonadales bacterium]|nr:hypothetical protein [Pseudomonadales bacterium]